MWVKRGWEGVMDVSAALSFVVRVGEPGEVTDDRRRVAALRCNKVGEEGCIVTSRSDWSLGSS